MTLAPAATNILTAAAPMPRDPPVIRATFLERSNLIDIASLLLLALRDRCCVHKRPEQCPRQSIVVITSLRMPLDGDDEVSGGGSLERLDHVIFRAASDDAQSIANYVR